MIMGSLYTEGWAGVCSIHHRPSMVTLKLPGFKTELQDMSAISAGALGANSHNPRSSSGTFVRSRVILQRTCNIRMLTANTSCTTHQDLLLQIYGMERGMAISFASQGEISPGIISLASSLLHV